ncbi:NCS2 family permease [Feifania hominis]|uniref:NCS2 family permease n=1 Tax=Feifania hominis TaxID=2763660 RepID=UPI003211A05C
MDKFFGLKAHGTDAKTEVIAGITTFFTMAYILFVNPTTLTDPLYIMGDPNADRYKAAVFVATCLSAFIGTMLMAVYAKIPFAQAPGMGLNAYFAYTVMLGMGYTFSQALAAVFISGVLFILITLFGLREAIVKAIPKNLKVAISAGIGLFIAFIGFQNAGIIVNNDSVLLGLQNFSEWTPAAATALVALIGVLIIGVLYKLKVKGAIIIGIIATTIVGIPFGVTNLSGFTLSLPDFGSFFELTFFKMDFAGLLKPENGFWGAVFNLVMVIIAFSMVDMFDTIGTLIGTAKKNNMLDEDGSMPRMKEALMCDAIATAAGACLGTSTVTTFVESSSGIAEGGRTGLTSFTTAILFLAALFLAPVVGIIPSAATAPALIIVGVLMLSSVKEIEFDDMTEAIPAFLTIAMMPFAYSIAIGIGFGVISYVLLKTFTGKFKDFSWVTVVIALMFVIRFMFIAG